MGRGGTGQHQRRDLRRTGLPQDLRSVKLEEENLHLQLELKAAEVRRELAEKLPRLAKSQDIDPAAEPGKKKTVRSKNRRRKRLQRSKKHPSL